MSTYSSFIYDKNNTGLGRLLIVPQRSGSSFTDAIVKNLESEHRSNLTFINSPEQAIHCSMLSRYAKPISIDLTWNSSSVNFQELFFNPGVYCNIVYRSPLKRYESGISMLLGGWEDNLLVPLQSLNPQEHKQYFEWFCDTTGRSRSEYLGHHQRLRESAQFSEWKRTVLQYALDMNDPGKCISPVFDFGFNETHMDPIMVKSALIACMFIHANFVLLDNYTDWVHKNIVSEDILTDTDEQIEHWRTGRGKDSNTFNDITHAQFLELKKQCYSAFNGDGFILNFDQWIGIEEEVYDYVKSMNGRFAQPSQKKQLIKYLIDLCHREPALFVRDNRLLVWVTNEHVLKRLPDKLRDAVKHNIAKGVKLMEDHGPLQWSKWANWDQN